METKKYIARPVEIEAFQLTEELHDPDNPVVFESNGRRLLSRFDSNFIVETLEGDMEAKVGDYIVIGTQGEIYPVRKDIFEHKYKEKRGDEE